MKVYLGAMWPGPLWESRGAFCWLSPLVPLARLHQLAAGGGKEAPPPPSGSQWEPPEATRATPAPSSTYLNTSHTTLIAVEMRNLDGKSYTNTSWSKTQIPPIPSLIG